jgi:hypothetical protein
MPETLTSLRLHFQQLYFLSRLSLHVSDLGARLLLTFDFDFGIIIGKSSLCIKFTTGDFMTRILLLTVSIFLFFSPAWAEDTALPSLGEVYAIDQAKYTVVGVGTQAFEYTSKGESLEIKIINKYPGTMVITPKKGDVVKVDPSVPMVWIAGVPHKEFLQNTFLKKSAKDKPFLLLEYIR